MTSLGLQPFLLYPAQLKITHNGRTITFESPQNAEDFIQHTFRPPPASQSRDEAASEPDNTEMDASDASTSQPPWVQVPAAEQPLDPALTANCLFSLYDSDEFLVWISQYSAWVIDGH